MKSGHGLSVAEKTDNGGRILEEVKVTETARRVLFCFYDKCSDVTK